MSQGYDEASRWRTLVETMPQIVWITRPDGWHVHFNQQWMDFTGLTLEESLGDGWNPPFHPEDRGRAAARWEEATRTGEPYEIEYRLRRHDGVYHWMLGRAMPLRDASGAIVRWFGTCTDIEDVKRAESRVEAQAELLATKHDRLNALATLSHHLNGAMTTDEVAQLMVHHAKPVIEASFVNVALIDEASQTLRIVQTDLDPDIAERWAVLPLDGADTPLHEAIRTREPVIVHDRDRQVRYPHMVEDTRRAGLRSTVSLPLCEGNEGVFGVIGCGWRSEIAVDAGLRAQLQLLADLCSQALQRTRRTEVQDGLVHELQDEVLAGHDAVEGLDVAIGYEPAQVELGFGGDWYDVIAIEAHRTAVVVGDVAGHGIAAAAEMTAAKAIIRGMVLTTEHERDVIPAANKALEHHRSAYIATVGVAWIDTDAAELTWRLAGHPPPVLRDGASGTRLLAGPQHPPLGMPSPARVVAAEQFGPGAILVLYTDGLIERRESNIDERLEVVRSLVESMPDGWSAARIRDRLLSELVDSDTVDDVAVVVVRNPPR